MSAAPPSVRRTLRLARHEAGHAVVTELLGGRVAEVRLLAKVTTKVRGVVQQHSVDAFTRRDRRVPMSPLSIACVCAAGNSVEHLYGYMDAGQYSAGDVIDLQEWLCDFDVGLLDHLVQRWLAVPRIRRMVDVVARELVKRDLTGADVRRLIGKKEKRKCR